VYSGYIRRKEQLKKKLGHPTRRIQNQVKRHKALLMETRAVFRFFRCF
jgi:hypothetical protein